MKITLTRSGGFSGLVQQAHCDTAELDPERAARMCSAAEDAIAAGAPPQPNDARALRDTRRYELAIEHAGHVHRFGFDETAMTPALVRLVQALMPASRS